MRTALVSVFVSLLFVSTASAQITNGSFDAGLTGWAPVVAGYGVISADGFGNPVNSVLFTTNNPSPNPPEGACTIYQQFECGPGPGACLIKVDYIVFVNNGATIAFDVVIDGNTNVSYYSTSTPGWVTFTTQVPCGSHLIAIAANFDSGPAFSTWSVYVDNVTASCEPVVRTEQSMWGRVKALYR